ncbi:MAG TPA: aldo/keto reductase [Stellaceae bacterium]|jgi:diketogulonate reductase-like aldo/keto reductase|nr:aldo/keto reductase [Stellaceae bacterium]
MRLLSLPDGAKVPVLGLGTWGMGERGTRGPDIIKALRLGLDLGMNLIDTAEMYGDGGAEEVVGEAVAGRRDELFLVSKVYPQNAGGKKLVAACDKSLKRLGTDRLDLYLLHWRGDVPLADTVAGFEALRAAGKIRRWGVSNLDIDDMRELWRIPDGRACAANQVLYNLSRRGIETGLIPWCREHGVPIMAYSPIEQGRILTKQALVKIAKARGVSPAQVALAWLIRQDGVIAIPKAADPDHVRDNAAALDLDLSPEELAALDHAFPRPRNSRLEML